MGDLQWHKNVFLLAILAGFMYSCGIKKSVTNRPDISKYSSDLPEKHTLNDSTFFAGNNFLIKNKQGLWELYVEGNPLEIGSITGLLSDSLMYKQEAVFFNKIRELVPSEGKQKFLRKFLSWYNRKMYKHIPEEYKAEIYGVSQYASTDFNTIAPPYLRALYLHGAHDIGHALQDLALVGCTSFAAWGEKTEDHKLLIGRNFDFYAGDEFAENKIIAFVKPDSGHPFMSVTWGGMMGVVSGMNTQGLTVTINAGKSKIPLIAKTPISILTREILQYASTIDEAIAIAKSRDVFVSESIMVGSAKDKRAVLIEVSPKKFGVYQVQNSNQLVCSNHFQSDAYATDRRNSKAITESHSAYRYQRMTSLLEQKDQLNPSKGVSILRNKKGLNDKNIGYGNEKALNQLLAHHGIVFQPEDLKVWISSNPYQLGEFVAYDLNAVFNNREQNPSAISLQIPALNIAKDPFLETQAYANYEAYRVVERKIESAIATNKELDETLINTGIRLNPEYWKAYALAGDYYYKTKKYQAAAEAYHTALNKEVPTLSDSKHLAKYLKKATRKAKK
ncbi:C45 family autoproteolytic acyltransferase/hydolase [Bizionia paragorgiae]|uniref:Acyl-coenzyme A:6-aminopenicillanic acid acyl-transferase n=1 Tax=Bizionia paragorgiae TaxID=283786 RepID=A0A1H4CD54_BIZPA|nr:C45 family autoproteolytic acyltransferase/hydolase [Bizionia paragorgiae]SEA58341.1 Acyl-coenzyme A:6-aminopenicillanic acid acyl-transferase [Bizionia paragorgiae]